MAWAVFIFGVVFIVAGFRGKIDDLNAVLKDDFAGRSNFLAWLVAILAIAAIGAYKPLRPISDGFLALVIIALLLSNRGFFAEFQRQVTQ